jgi:CRP/FNR family cyclic AMP-dependent transcriptional regulator
MKSADTGSGSADSNLGQAWSTLLRFGWLAERDAAVQAQLRSVARLLDVERGEYLYHVNDATSGIFGLVTGGLDITIPRLDGEELTIYRADTGFWIGDLALFAGRRRLVSVRAASKSRLVHLPEDKLRSLVRSVPELVADFYELSYKNMALALQLLGNIAVTGATERVALRLLMHSEHLADAGGWIELSQKSLSELVSLSLQSIRRAVADLEQSGLVETAYGRIRIADRYALAERCGYRLRASPGNAVAARATRD